MYRTRHYVAFTTVALLILSATFIFLTQTFIAHADDESPSLDSAVVQGPEPIAVIKNLLVGGSERTEASLNEIKLTRVAGGDETVSADTRLYAGDELTTGPNAQLTILFLDEAAEKSNEVLVDANSRVRVGSIFTWLGKVLIRCRGAFDARSEKVRLGVQGTEFELLVEPDGTNKVTVLEGAVSVENLLSASLERLPEESSSRQPLFLKASYHDFLQQPKPISLVAVTGQVARLENVFPFTNRCGQRHHYEIAAPRNLGWFRFINAESFELTGRETRSLVFSVELDTRRVATGRYEGEILARCLDCHLEPNCDLGGLVLPISINVIPRGADSVGTPGSSPTPGGRGTPGPRSVIARPRQEVVVDENGLRPPVNASDQELAASVNWSNSVILAGQPSYPAQSVVPHFSSWSARDQQFREARLNAVLRDDPQAYETLGDVYTDWGNGAKAAEAYRRVRVPPSQLTAEDLADRAEALRLAGNLDEAESLLKRAVGLDADSPSALNTIGNVFRDRARLARDRREYKLADGFLNRARIAYDRALKATPPSGGVPAPTTTRRSAKDLSVVSASNVGEVLFEQGELARDLGQNDEALRQYLMAEGAFRRAAEIDPSYSLARNGLGDTLHAAGEAAKSQGDQAQANAFFRDSTTEYNRALTLNRDMSEAQVGLGNVALSKGQKLEAIRRYTRAAQLRPEQPEPHYRLATTLVDVNPRLAAEYAATFLKLERRVFRTGERARIAEGIKSEQITSNPSPSPIFPPSPILSPRVSPSPFVTPTPTPTPSGPLTKVPGLKGDKPEKARSDLVKLGFQVQFKDQPDCDGSGKVVSSDPVKDARVPRGSMVTVYVSSFGENPERVPDLNGSLMRDAEQMLREVGLTMKVARREETDRAPRNTIIRQKPDSGRPFKRGCQVEVTIAIPIPPVTVRDFVGMNVNQAEQAISFSGLSMGNVLEVESRQVGGTVLDQEPRAGATVPRGTPVNLTISRIEWVEVPNVVNHSYGGAVEILSGYGLNHRVMGGNTRNDVVKQDPPAGRRVPKGTTVKLWFPASEPGEQ